MEGFMTSENLEKELKTRKAREYLSSLWGRNLLTRKLCKKDKKFIWRKAAWHKLYRIR